MPQKGFEMTYFWKTVNGTRCDFWGDEGKTYMREVANKESIERGCYVGVYTYTEKDVDGKWVGIYECLYAAENGKPSYKEGRGVIRITDDTVYDRC